MAKRSKRRGKQRAGRRPSPQLIRGLTAATALYQDGEIEAAQKALIKLIEQYPSSKSALVDLIEISAELQDWRTYAYYAEQLLPLERGDDKAETLNNLVYAHSQLVYPALAWYFAKELVTNYPDFPKLKQTQSLLTNLEPKLLEKELFLDKTAVSPNEKLNFMAQHDHIRFYTESGKGQAAIATAQAFLAKTPDVVPVLNNLSLAQFMIGEISQAKATSAKVLAQEPDNYHALGNLVRYAVLTAQFDEAREYAERLAQITTDDPDLPIKQAEAFAFLGDDQKVQAAYERSLGQNSRLDPLLLYLAGVAAYRLGDEKKAWQLWRKAVKQMPSLHMAQESLAEKRLPVGERNIPWYWPFAYWFPNDLGELLHKYLGGDGELESSQAVEKGMKSILAERPYFPQLFPHILEFGDRAAREFVLNFARATETPELLQVLYDFALSSHGSDSLRMEALQFISQRHPHLLPDSRQVNIWMNGEPHEIVTIAFEITDEPTLDIILSEEIMQKYEESIDLILEDELEQAEQMLQQMIAAAPHFPSAYNQLATVYERQGHLQETRDLIEDTHARFPDYLFARIGLARLLTQEKRLEEARELIKPILSLPQLHISEFRALARAQMDIALAADQIEGARTWLQLWRQVEEGNPELLEWQIRIEGPKAMLDNLEKLMGRAPQKKWRR